MILILLELQPALDDGSQSVRVVEFQVLILLQSHCPPEIKIYMKQPLLSTLAAFLPNRYQPLFHHTPNSVHKTRPVLHARRIRRRPNQAPKIRPRAPHPNLKVFRVTCAQPSLATRRHRRPITALVDALAGNNHPIQPRHPVIIKDRCLIRNTIHVTCSSYAPFFNHEMFGLGSGLVNEVRDEVRP